MKFSIIIPVYNVEAYIQRCLDSVLNQSFKDFEIIVVDDCGEDCSIRIVQDYTSKFSQIKIVRNPYNKGPMISRQNGWNAARGEYVIFIDGDDTLPKNALEKYNKVLQKSHSDIIIGCIEDILPNGEVHISKVYAEGVYSISDAYAMLLDRKIKHSMCGKVFKRFLFNSIECFEGLRNSEDLLTFIQVLSKCKYITLINDIVYNYHFTPNSSSRRRFSEKQFDSMIFSINYCHKFLTKKCDNTQLVTYIVKKIAAICTLGISKRSLNNLSQNIIDNLTIKSFYTVYGLKGIIYKILYHSQFTRNIISLYNRS